MSKYQVGDRVGLLVIKEVHKGKYIVDCDCGERTEVSKNSLCSSISRGKSLNYKPGCKKCAITRVWEKRRKFYDKQNESYIGLKRPGFTVVDFFYKVLREGKGQKVLMFRCLCNCGATFEPRAHRVLKDTIQGCTSCAGKRRRKPLKKEKGTWRKVTSNEVIVDTVCIKCAWKRTFTIFEWKKYLAPLCNHCRGNEFLIEGVSLNKTQMGKKFGYSRERVRQLINQYGIDEAITYMKRMRDLTK